VPAGDHGGGGGDGVLGAGPVYEPADYFRVASLGEIFGGLQEGERIEVDLGCGDGDFLVGMAKLYPGRKFLGIERLLGRCRKVARKIRRGGLGNARVLRLDSCYALGWLLPEGSVGRLHLLCPDPWPKRKQHKNRLTRQDEFLWGLERVMAEGGEVLVKSDHRGYFDEVRQTLGGLSWLRELGWEEGEFPYVVTGFEKHWLAAGREIWRGRWRREGGAGGEGGAA
jgi:tRNA (guanine-N7-)-methyltransferase